MHKQLLDDRDELKNLAIKLGMHILETLPLENVSKKLVEKIPYAFVKKYRALPFREDEKKVVLAVSDPLNFEPIEDLRLMLDKDVETYFCSEKIIQQAIDHLYHEKVGKTQALLSNPKQAKESRPSNVDDTDATYDLLESKEEAPIIRLLNLILSEAISQGASDIHFEPYEDRLKVRYRIDGVLTIRHTPEKEIQSQMLTRIKVMARLDIAEHRLPQDGRMKLKMGGREIDFRVSTLPTAYGERIVLRILDKGNVQLGLDKLGLLPKMLDSYRKLITSPEGMILVTGPTGSGKTTTLYSTLFELYSDEINIMTIEDPVEYKLKGIAQIGVHPKIGLTFAAGLRHILRQDPDVVMVGEIRDTETAEIAIQASLTGHLVVATLHTNDAPSAIPRLIDMGIEPYLLSATVIGVVAQRLIRTICPNCREGYTPREDELDKLGLTKDELNAGKIYRGHGCPLCFGSGYKGRHGLYELMSLTPHMQTLIAKRASHNLLKEEALKEGMVTLREHGAHLVKTGMTTIKEVLRLTRK